MTSADWPKCLARPVSFLIKIKPIFFDFLEIRHVPFRIWSNLAYFLSTQTSINRGKRSELRALLFWLLYSLYVNDILEAFALRTSFLLVKYFSHQRGENFFDFLNSLLLKSTLIQEVFNYILLPGFSFPLVNISWLFIAWIWLTYFNFLLCLVLNSSFPCLDI